MAMGWPTPPNILVGVAGKPPPDEPSLGQRVARQPPHIANEEKQWRMAEASGDWWLIDSEGIKINVLHLILFCYSKLIWHSLIVRQKTPSFCNDRIEVIPFFYMPIMDDCWELKYRNYNEWVLFNDKVFKVQWWS